MPDESAAPDLTTSRSPLTFARRAEPDELPELMDQPCAYEELRDCFSDFAQMNRMIRGYPPTLAFLDRIVRHFPHARPLRILDVGSGGGDTLRAVARWAAAQSLSVSLTGIDLNPHATRAALELTERTPQHPHAAKISFVTADVFTYKPAQPPDIVLSALFTHHLSSAEIIRFLDWMEQSARLGWFINDLHRSARAAFWFGPLAWIMRWHRFIRHDGPVSLRRAFTPSDWQQLLAAANISNAAIESHAMNRLCISRIRELP